MIKEAISTLVAGEDLTPETMKQVMEEIMTGEATDAQKASFLTALAIKGETIEEITEAAKVMRSHCAPFDNDMDTLEIVGTDQHFYTGSIDHECSRHQDNQTW